MHSLKTVKYSFFWFFFYLQNLFPSQSANTQAESHRVTTIRLNKRELLIRKCFIAFVWSMLISRTHNRPEVAKSVGITARGDYILVPTTFRHSSILWCGAYLVVMCVHRWSVEVRYKYNTESLQSPIWRQKLQEPGMEVSYIKKPDSGRRKRVTWTPVESLHEGALYDNI